MKKWLVQIRKGEPGEAKETVCETGLQCKEQKKRRGPMVNEEKHGAFVLSTSR